MKRASAILFLPLVLAAVQCGGPGKLVTPAGQRMHVPRWYANPPQPEKRLIAVASAASRDLQTAIDKARQDGRAEIARQLSINMKDLSKRFVDETILSEDARLRDHFNRTTESVMAESLSGTRIARQKLTQQDDLYRVYVMMEMPLGEATRRLVERIQEQSDLYKSLRESEAYKGLEKGAQQHGPEPEAGGAR
ncbi:MAG: LPP20 family lipoprotein [Acidobacteriota bacterium]